ANARSLLIDLFRLPLPAGNPPMPRQNLLGRPFRAARESPGLPWLVQTILSFLPQGRSGANHAAFLRDFPVRRDEPGECRNYGKFPREKPANRRRRLIRVRHYPVISDVM